MMMMMMTTTLPMTKANRSSRCLLLEVVVVVVAAASWLVLVGLVTRVGAFSTTPTTRGYHKAASCIMSRTRLYNHDTNHKNVVVVTTTTTTTPNNNVQQQQDEEQEYRRRFMYMTAQQDETLQNKGAYETSLMQNPRALKPHKVQRGGARSSSGFGGDTKNNNNNNNKKKVGSQTTSSLGHQNHDKLAALQSHAKTLQLDGVVRIDNVLSSPVADALRDYVIDLRERATADVESKNIVDSQERFADVLLNQNRCDLKIPLGPEPVHAALYQLFADKKKTCIVRDVMEYVFDYYDGVGKDAELWELNCFMSNAGARRQLVHADVVSLEPVIGLKNKDEPIMLTCFVALQDIDATMGPTVWMTGTHTLQAHNRFFETGIDEASTRTNSYSPKDEILKSSKSVLGTIPKGSCVIFDPRTLHCAGANTCTDPEKTRALFYVSFKNPKIDNPGCPSTSGYGVATAEITMEELVNDLRAEKTGEPTKRIQQISCFP